MFYPGEVHFIPPDADEDGDQKFRRHLLLANCDDAADFATFAYASSQPTDAGHGAAYVLVDPFRTRYHRTGLQGATDAYPSRLVSVDPSDLTEMHGRVMDEMPKIREEVEKALGLGDGNVNGPGARRWELAGSLYSS